MSFKFEKLRVGQLAMDLGESINQISVAFPPSENFNLKSKICRAADSVALNIAEGSVGQTNAEFRKFLGYAIRSLSEVVTCLYKAKYRNYIQEDSFKEYYESSFNLVNQLIALRNSLKDKN